ncbi:MAG: hypothetical protein JW841_15810 [Deltaproteobacteria bacterium]|nr:hypothetical protein [Deltaproteobacteria bacterium]
MSGGPVARADYGSHARSNLESVCTKEEELPALIEGSVGARAMAEDARLTMNEKNRRTTPFETKASEKKPNEIAGPDLQDTTVHPKFAQGLLQLEKSSMISTSKMAGWTGLESAQVSDFKGDLATPRASENEVSRGYAPGPCYVSHGLASSQCSNVANVANEAKTGAAESAGLAESVGLVSRELENESPSKQLIKVLGEVLATIEAGEVEKARVMIESLKIGVELGSGRRNKNM